MLVEEHVYLQFEGDVDGWLILYYSPNNNTRLSFWQAMFVAAYTSHLQLTILLVYSLPHP